MHAPFRCLLGCLFTAGLCVFAVARGPSAAGGPPVLAQVREMDPRLRQIIDRERYVKRGYVKRDGRWVKVKPTPKARRLVDKLSDGDRPKLTVHVIDVGQGDSIFIQTPNGKNILLDAGFGPCDWSDYDAGEKRVLPYLEYLGVKKLDAVIVSHPHNDHDGGITTVLRKMKVDALIDSGYKHTATHYYNVLKFAREKGLKYIQVKAGDRLKIDPAVEIEVLNPPNANAYNGTNSDTNNSSIVLRLTYGEVTVLLTGDAEKAAEEKMLRNRYNLKAHILKVAHHGSKTSSSERFLGQVGPEAAVISCGLNNRYGLPKDEILRRFERKRVKMSRTDFDSTVVATTDGQFYTIDAFGDVPHEYKGFIIGDTERKMYYLPGSKYYARVYPGRRRYFKTEKEAKAAGLEKSNY